MQLSLVGAAPHCFEQATLLLGFGYHVTLHDPTSTHHEVRRRIALSPFARPITDGIELEQFTVAESLAHAGSRARIVFFSPASLRPMDRVHAISELTTHMQPAATFVVIAPSSLEDVGEGEELCQRADVPYVSVSSLASTVSSPVAHMVIGSRSAHASAMVETVLLRTGASFTKTDPETALFLRAAQSAMRTAMSQLAAEAMALAEAGNLDHEAFRNAFIAEGLKVAPSVDSSFGELSALVARSAHGPSLAPLLDGLLNARDQQPERIFDQFLTLLRSMIYPTIAIVGTRRAVSSHCRQWLSTVVATAAQCGTSVRIHHTGPLTMIDHGGAHVTVHPNAYDSVRDADLCLVLGDDPDLTDLDWFTVESLMRVPRIFDPYLQLDYRKLSAHGIQVNA